jgi:hypothetical protein
MVSSLSAPANASAPDSAAWREDSRYWGPGQSTSPSSRGRYIAISGT